MKGLVDRQALKATKTIGALVMEQVETHHIKKLLKSIKAACDCNCTLNQVFQIDMRL